MDAGRSIVSWITHRYRGGYSNRVESRVQSTEKKRESTTEKSRVESRVESVHNMGSGETDGDRTIEEPGPHPDPASTYSTETILYSTIPCQTLPNQ